jgi:YHS domain-containing protein
MNTGHAQLIDPVCGMSVTDRLAHRAHYGAGDYYFCSASCHEIHGGSRTLR